MYFEAFKMSSTTVRLVVAGLIGLLLLSIVIFGPAACQRIRSLTAQSKVERGQSGAFHNSAADAINTVGDVAANQAETAAVSRQNEEEIRNAKGADQRVDPAANAAGLRALCKRRSHRDDPACRVLDTHP